MTVQYFPKKNKDWSDVPGMEVAFAVCLPDSYSEEKKWPWGMAVHGIGERGAGTYEQLRNLIEGPDYTGDGVPDGQPFIKEWMKAAVDEYGMVLIVPTYEGFFDANKVNWLYNFVQKTFSLVAKFKFSGFSLGGGACINYITSTLENANKVAIAIPCAPTYNMPNPSIVGKANLPVHLFVNTHDTNGATNLSVTKKIVDNINQYLPDIRADFTAFKKSGHGGYDEATTITPPIASGGEGLTNAGENIYQWYLDVLAHGPRPLRAAGEIPVPIPEEPLPPVIIEPIVSHKIEGSEIALIGSKSTGYKDGLDGRWTVEAPPGVKYEEVFPGGSGYIDAHGFLPKPGKYLFIFTLKGVPEPVTIEVLHGKVITSYDSRTGKVGYNDGTTADAHVVYDGVWKVIINGEIVTI